MRRSTVNIFDRLTSTTLNTRTANSVVMAVLAISLLNLSESQLFAQAAGNANATKLPANFKPPQATPKAMEIEKELITDQEEEDFKRSKGARIGKGFIQWQKAIKNTNPSNEEKDLIAYGAWWAISRFSMKKYRHTLPKLRDEYLRYVKYTAKGKGKLALLPEFTKQCENLLDGNAIVRLNAVWLLNQLNTVEPQINKKVPPAVPFVPVMVPLMKIVNDPDQLESVKVAAVVGLTRIMLDGPPEEVPRQQIAKALLKELQKPDLHYWYQFRLIKGLGASRESFSDPAQQNPEFVNTLVVIMGDTKRNWIVRAEAAKAVGRLPLDGNINVDVVLFQIVKLCKDMADAYNNKPSNFQWKNCFLKVYLAFVPYDAHYKFGRNSLIDRKKNGQGAVTAAYQQTLPLVRHMIKSNPRTPERIPTEILDGVGQWIESNRPDNFRVAPNLDPITQQGSESSQPATQPASAGS